MKTTHNMTRILVGALLSGGVALAGAWAPGIAHANGGPYTWCPGQSMDWPTGPNTTTLGMHAQYVWDMNVCHTWYKVTYGYGNVPRIVNGASTLQGSNTWDGDDPPPPNPSGVNCGLMWCPVPPHPDPNFHG